MSTLAKVQLHHVQVGDRIVINSHVWNVKYTDGPDRIGTYDVGLIDDWGISKIEILTGLVTIEV